MKMFLSSYELQNKLTEKVRKGYLLKLQTKGFEAGYADIFPWEEFGDPRAEDIPQLLRSQQLPPLLKQSLFFANLDGVARSKGHSLNTGKSLQNHFLVDELSSFSLEDFERAISKGFTRFKIKVCRDIKTEVQKIKKIIPRLNDSVKLRLDCNSQGTEEFFNSILDFEDKIEFIEDPFGDSSLWQSHSLFAYDQPPFEYKAVETSWQVIKPAKQKLSCLKAPHAVFTSYMDHPVGVAHAFHQAASYSQVQRADYGLMSHHVYNSNEFYNQLICEGPKLSFVEDIGIGFSKSLEKQKWVKL